jgi:hypothetical protein
MQELPFYNQVKASKIYSKCKKAIKNIKRIKNKDYLAWYAKPKDLPTLFLNFDLTLGFPWREKRLGSDSHIYFIFICNFNLTQNNNNKKIIW